jgi:DNA-binding transcriptional regulator YhcF (GntR family)
MMLIVDGTDRRPPYEQLRQQLITAIRSGELPGGSKLPTVRKLATDLGVAPNTVARTYLELERDGLVETRGRRGSFVAGRPEPGPAEDAARQAADVYVQLIRKLSIDDSTALNLVRAALGRD